MVWAYDEYFLLKRLWEIGWKVHVVLDMISYGENIGRKTGER